jgi:DNA (cytosine-5)-methyltransferase 1
VSAYYNDNDPFAAAWLRELIRADLIAPGDVDERSIEDVKPDDLRGYHQHHFFAGIGTWSYALRLAGWPDDQPVWTGSCPCQPFSKAGQHLGFLDQRHLWPAWFWLLAQCRPRVVFGEQVADPAGLQWLDLVSADLEGEGYRFGAVDLCAAGFGAPHIRQRLWWVADAFGAGLERQPRHGDHGGQSERLPAQPHRPAPPRGTAGGGRRTLHGHWSDCDWLLCRDGRWRPVQPGTFPLAHGAAARMGRLRGYGNALVAPLATEFVRAYRDG